MENRNKEVNLYPEKELEDLSPDEVVSALKAIGKETGRRAIAEAKALGLPVTFVEKELIIKEFPDGRREILGKVPPAVKVEKGAVYEVKAR
ncbi:MAG: hypothetical protein HY842_19595 [Bacteroidetes bacterium]|nr:hypothetical protein [Bacteroidota bacterium]